MEQSERKASDDSPAFDTLDPLEILIDRTWAFLENQAEAKITKSIKNLGWWRHFDLVVSLESFVCPFSNKKMLYVLSTKSCDTVLTTQSGERGIKESP